MILAHNHIHFLGKGRKIKGFFTSGVPATDNSYSPLTVEETVVRGTGTHSHTSVFLLIGKTEILGRRTRGNDYRVCHYKVATVVFTHERTLEKSTFVMMRERMSAPNLSACLRITPIISFPSIPSGKPGKFSISEV